MSHFWGRYFCKTRNLIDVFDMSFGELDAFFFVDCFDREKDRMELDAIGMDRVSSNS